MSKATTFFACDEAARILSALPYGERCAHVSSLLTRKDFLPRCATGSRDGGARIPVRLTDAALARLEQLGGVASRWVDGFVVAAHRDAVRAAKELWVALPARTGTRRAIATLWRVAHDLQPTTTRSFKAALRFVEAEPTWKAADLADHIGYGTKRDYILQLALELHAAAPVRSAFALALAEALGEDPKAIAEEMAEEVAR
jgi:hypothetical protein